MTQVVISQLPVAIIVLLVILYAHSQRFERVSIILLALAVLLCAFHISHTSWNDFTIDASAHMDYIRFILEHGRMPTPDDGMGGAVRHPPAYYLLAAFSMKAADILAVGSPEQYARYVSLALYAVFLVMGAQLLRSLLADAPAAYLISLCMFLFWPIGITMSGRTTCDLLLFAGQAGILCALVRWLKEPQPAFLPALFFWAGISMLGKNSGMIMIGFAALAFLVTAYTHRNRFKELLRFDLAGSLLFAVACASLSVRHGWIMKHVDDNLGIHYNWDYLWQLAGSFNVFLLFFDTQLGLSQESFWNMWLHTLLLGAGNMPWHYPVIMMMLKIIWCMMLFYGAAGIIRSWRRIIFSEKAALFLLAVFIAFMMASALYLLLRTSNFNYTDARYAYPAVIGFALLHGIAMKYDLLAGRIAAYRIGAALGSAFTVLAIALILLQHLDSFIN